MYIFYKPEDKIEGGRREQPSSSWPSVAPGVGALSDQYRVTPAHAPPPAPVTHPSTSAFRLLIEPRPNVVSRFIRGKLNKALEDVVTRQFSIVV